MTKDYYIDYEVIGHLPMTVQANNPSEARMVAEEQLRGACFGDLENLEINICNVEEGDENNGNL